MARENQATGGENSISSTFVSMPLNSMVALGVESPIRITSASEPCGDCGYGISRRGISQSVGAPQYQQVIPVGYAMEVPAI